MAMLDLYPSAERAINIIDIKLITEREYQILKKISTQIRKKIEDEFDDNAVSYGMIKYFIENRIRNSNITDIETATKKEIVISNILLPDDIEIAEILNKNGFNLELLKELLKIRQKLINIIIYNLQLDEELKDQYETYKNNIKKLINLFEEKYNINDQTIILNKIAEILVLYPNYLENKITSTIKKR